MYHYSERIGRVNASAVREILKLMADPEIISFGGGSPAKEALDGDVIREIANKLLTEKPDTMLSYGITEGWEPLRQAYVDHIARPKGVNVTADHVLVATGATSGILLASDVFLNEGDTVLVESPTFLSILMVFNLFNCNCVPVETDDDGMLMDDLEAKIKNHRPKLLYTVPTFQNPTGRTLSLERRKRVAELAGQYEMIVMEDDPYCDLRYKGDALPPIKAFDTADNVLLVNSFSKIISPGLRVGTVAANPEIIAKMTIAKQCTDTHTAILAQAICADYLNRGLLPGHLKAVAPMYKERLDAMIEGIEKYFPAGTVHTNPEGGLFVWVRLPGKPDIAELLKIATRKYKVAFVPGTPFYLDPADGSNSIRLNFSSNTPGRIETGMKRLGELFADL
ncbi:MAG: PLP-dependent aminotransferase family protein [Clostridiales bacterium]|nr:PLP-dependent aminotransferase family protein [Clostridiales bacterium]